MDINVFAKFYEIPSLPFKILKNQNVAHGQTDGWMGSIIKHWKSKIMQEKESNMRLSADRKFRPFGSLFGITRHRLAMPNSYPWDGIFYRQWGLRTSHPSKVLIIYK